MNNTVTETFITKAKEIHGNKYDYSKVEYVNATTKVCIICPEHGEFWQAPSKHLGGQGCPKCVGKNMTSEYFLKKCKEIYDDKYSYEKTVYTKKNGVIIIYKIHGFQYLRKNYFAYEFLKNINRFTSH